MFNRNEVLEDQVVGTRNPQHDVPLLAEMDSDSKRPFVDGRRKKQGQEAVQADGLRKRESGAAYNTEDASPVPQEHPKAYGMATHRGSRKKVKRAENRTLGKPGSDLSLEDDDISTVDARDPDYDLDSQENWEFKSIHRSSQRRRLRTPSTHFCSNALSTSRGTNEVVLSLEESNLSEMRSDPVCV